MTFNQLLKHFGSQVKAARALGFSRQAVNQWKTDGIRPATQKRIEIMTRGKLKADGGK